MVPLANLRLQLFFAPAFICQMSVGCEDTLELQEPTSMHKKVPECSGYGCGAETVEDCYFCSEEYAQKQLEDREKRRRMRMYDPLTHYLCPRKKQRRARKIFSTNAFLFELHRAYDDYLQRSWERKYPLQLTVTGAA